MFIKFKEQPSRGGEIRIDPNKINAILSSKAISDFEQAKNRCQPKKPSKYLWSVEIIYDRSYAVLGYYDTPERALEILDDVEETIDNLYPEFETPEN